MNYDELVNTALDAGFYLLQYGAETYRVEESMQRILVAYGVENPHVFAITSCIIVTIKDGEGTPYTQLRRILHRATDLGKVAKLNDLCRWVCSQKPDFVLAKSEFKKAVAAPEYGFWFQAAAYGVIGTFFTLFFGGNARDAVIAFFCGSLSKIVLDSLAKFYSNLLFNNIIGAAVIALIAFLSARLGLCDNMDKTIIGPLMNLVPGVALTNSMRDIISGDLIAGITKLTEALLIAVAIAIGTGIVISGLRMVFGM